MTKREESDNKLIHVDGHFLFGNESGRGFSDNPEWNWDAYSCVSLSDGHIPAGAIVRYGNRYGYFYCCNCDTSFGLAYTSEEKKTPFPFDDIRVIAGYHHDFIGYLAFRKGRKWGVLRLAEPGGMVQYLEGSVKLIVPCKFDTFQLAVDQIHEPGYYDSNQKWLNFERASEADLYYDDGESNLDDLQNISLATPAVTPTYIRKWFTPDSITRLKRNQIFVFGSNLNGFHGGGAAAYAMQHFGAQWGEGVGITGQCYAIPTMHGGADDIRPYVEDFIDYAQQHPELEFLVTPIGCGIAGFTPETMAPLFRRALEFGNIVLPKSFVEVLGNY